MDWSGDLTAFETFRNKSSAFIQATFPVADSDFILTSAINPISSVDHSGSDKRLNPVEMGLWFVSTPTMLRMLAPMADRFVVVVPLTWFDDTTTSFSGYSGLHNPYISTLNLVAAVDTGSPNGSVSVAAHEVGHSFGLNLNCEEYNPCNTTRKDGIGNYAANGLWVAQHMPIRPSIAAPVYNFMGSTNDRPYWVSQESYTKLLTDRDQPVVAALNAVEDGVVVISGMIKNDGTGSLASFYRLPAAAIDSSQTGSYAIVQYDAGGTELGRYSFDVAFTWEGTTLTEAPFAFTIPFYQGATRIVLLKDSTSLVERVVSPHTPVVAITAPAGGAQVRGPVSLQWSGNDTDGDTLEYTAMVSADNGATWSPIAFAIHNTAATLDPTGIPPGTNYRVKVVATDGVNTGEAVSNAFTVFQPLFLPLIRR